MGFDDASQFRAARCRRLVATIKGDAKIRQQIGLGWPYRVETDSFVTHLVAASSTQLSRLAELGPRRGRVAHQRSAWCRLGRGQ